MFIQFAVLPCPGFSNKLKSHANSNVCLCIISDSTLAAIDTLHYCEKTAPGHKSTQSGIIIGEM